MVTSNNIVKRMLIDTGFYLVAMSCNIILVCLGGYHLWSHVVVHPVFIYAGMIAALMSSTIASSLTTLYHIYKRVP